MCLTKNRIREWKLGTVKVMRTSTHTLLYCTCIIQSMCIWRIYGHGPTVYKFTTNNTVYTHKEREIQRQIKGKGGMWFRGDACSCTWLLCDPNKTNSSLPPAPYKRPQITASPSSFITPWGSKTQLSLSQKPPAPLHTYETKHAHSSEPSHVPSNTYTLSTDRKTTLSHTCTGAHSP